MTNNNDTFHIHTYGRTELAQIYFPNLTSQAAWRKLHRWIELNPELRSTLGSDRQLRKMRTFSPRQVKLICHYLGEPDTIWEE